MPDISQPSNGTSPRPNAKSYQDLFDLAERRGPSPINAFVTGRDNNLDSLVLLKWNDSGGKRRPWLRWWDSKDMRRFLRQGFGQNPFRSPLPRLDSVLKDSQDSRGSSSEV